MFFFQINYVLVQNFWYANRTCHVGRSTPPGIRFGSEQIAIVLSAKNKYRCNHRRRYCLNYGLSYATGYQGRRQTRTLTPRRWAAMVAVSFEMCVLRFVIYGPGGQKPYGKNVISVKRVPYKFRVLFNP